MATHLSTFGELEAMPKEELRKEIVSQRALVRKMRLGILLNKEKDSAKYRRERRQLARMLTVHDTVEAAAPAAVKAASKQAKDLKKKPKSSRVSAPSAS